MSGEVLLTAIERTEKPQVSRREGFIPGVVYGENANSGKSVKFESTALLKTLKGHVKNARVLIKVGGNDTHCIIKDIQKDPVTGKIIHIDLQSISASEIVKLKIPVVYKGRNKLEMKGFVLDTMMPEVEVIGSVDLIPESAEIDVSGKTQGDKIIVNDITIDNRIKLHHNMDEVVAVIVAPKDRTSGEPVPAGANA
ncbi:MAG: 50S ribosomal protein L25 [Bacillota bacterium]|nr:50S ribosomal protein L25 [Bacillota bacterium]